MAPPFQYGVYGIALRSEFALTLPRFSGGAFAEIELRYGTPALFAEAIAGSELIERADWYHYAHLADGSSYACWSGLGEFLVSAAGDRIDCMRAPEAAMESFQVYLLGQALSFALVKSGAEPLHATAIEWGGEAIALLGDSGFGKSTLAASFIAAGCRLLTDDLLLVRQTGEGMCAFPGPSRIKLFPDSAERFLGPAVKGVPMNATTSKHVIPLEAARRCRTPVPLRALYVLTAPEAMRGKRRVRIESLTVREAFFELVRGTFNRYIDDAARLQRQFAETTMLLNAVPVRKLSYPRSLARLPDVRELILADSGMGQRRTA